MYTQICWQFLWLPTSSVFTTFDRISCKYGCLRWNSTQALNLRIHVQTLILRILDFHNDHWFRTTQFLSDVFLIHHQLLFHAHVSWAHIGVNYFHVYILVIPYFWRLRLWLLQGFQSLPLKNLNRCWLYCDWSFFKWYY